MKAVKVASIYYTALRYDCVHNSGLVKYLVIYLHFHRISCKWHSICARTFGNDDQLLILVNSYSA